MEGVGGQGGDKRDERVLGGGEDGRERERGRQGLSLSYNSWAQDTCS